MADIHSFTAELGCSDHAGSTWAPQGETPIVSATGTKVFHQHAVCHECTGTPAFYDSWWNRRRIGLQGVIGAGWWSVQNDPFIWLLMVIPCTTQILCETMLHYCKANWLFFCRIIHPNWIPMNMFWAISNQGWGKKSSRIKSECAPYWQQCLDDCREILILSKDSLFTTNAGILFSDFVLSRFSKATGGF